MWVAGQASEPGNGLPLMMDIAKVSVFDHLKDRLETRDIHGVEKLLSKDK